MKKNWLKKISTSIYIIIIGWILNAYAWTYAPPQISTISLVFGVFMFLGGGILLIINIIHKLRS